MKRTLLPILMIPYLLCGCGKAAETPANTPMPTEEIITTEEPVVTEIPEAAETEEAGTMTVTIGERSYVLILETNNTAEAFHALCPATLDMEELNGNEKYIYLDDALPSDPRSVGEIRAGDLMLFGDSCVVLFYESFSTSYSYTPIGHMENTEGLRDAVGAGAVHVIFQ